MLLPDKYISVAQSILSVGAYVLRHIDDPASPDELYALLRADILDGSYPANQSFDNLLLAIDYLYMTGVVEMDQSGRIYRCD